MSGLNDLLRKSAKGFAGQPTASPGAFVGEAGKRQEFILRCVDVIDLANCYSEKIYKFVDEEGNLVINFANKAGEWFVGNKYRIKATVKAHKEYQGEKQTLINRLKTIELFYERPQAEAQESGDASSAWLRI